MSKEFDFLGNVVSISDSLEKARELKVQITNYFRNNIPNIPDNLSYKNCRSVWGRLYNKTIDIAVEYSQKNNISECTRETIVNNCKDFFSNAYQEFNNVFENLQREERQNVLRQQHVSNSNENSKNSSDLKFVGYKPIFDYSESNNNFNEYNPNAYTPSNTYDSKTKNEPSTLDNIKFGIEVANLGFWGVANAITLVSKGVELVSDTVQESKLENESSAIAFNQVLDVFKRSYLNCVHKVIDYMVLITTKNLIDTSNDATTIINNLKNAQSNSDIIYYCVVLLETNPLDIENYQLIIDKSKIMPLELVNISIYFDVDISVQILKYFKKIIYYHSKELKDFVNSVESYSEERLGVYYEPITTLLELINNIIAIIDIKNLLTSDFIEVSTIEEKRNTLEQLNSLNLVNEKNIFNENDFLKIQNELIEKLTSHIIAQENKILDDLCVNIKDKNISQLNDLINIIVECEEYHQYHSETLDSHISIINDRIKCLQIEDLENLCSKIPNLNLDELSILENTIKNKDYPLDLTKSYLNDIYNQIVNIQSEDLLDLCIDLEKLNFEELNDIHRKIVEKHYYPEVADEFLVLVEEQIVAFQKKDLNNLCSNLHKLNHEELNSIYNAILNKGYDDTIVEPYLVKVNDNIIEFEKKDLFCMCSNISQLNQMELNVLKDKIISKKYHDDVVQKYVSKVDSQIVNFATNDLNNLCKDVNILGIDELIQLREAVLSKKYEKNITTSFVERIDSTIFDRERNSLLENLQNDINSLEHDSLSLEFSSLTKEGSNTFKVSKYINYDDIYSLLNDRLNKLEISHLDSICRCMDSLDLSGIETLINNVNSLNYRSENKNGYISKLNNRFKSLKVSALNKICDKLSSKSYDELKDVSNVLNNLPYEMSLKLPYYTKLNSAIRIVRFSNYIQRVESISKQFSNVASFKVITNQMQYLKSEHEIINDKIKRDNDIVNQNYTIDMLASQEVLIAYYTQTFLLKENKNILITDKRLYIPSYGFVPFQDLQSIKCNKGLLNSNITINLKSGDIVKLPCSKSELDSLSKILTFFIE